MFQNADVEIDNQTHSLVHQPEACQQLCDIDVRDVLDRLDFDDDLLVDNKVGSEGFIDVDCSVDERYRLFDFDGEISLEQPLSQEQ